MPADTPRPRAWTPRPTPLALAALAAAVSGCPDPTVALRTEGPLQVEGRIPVQVSAEVPVRLSGELPVEFSGQIPVRVEATLRVEGPSVAWRGVYVSEDLLGHIEEGKTRADWLRAVIGEPTARATLDDGTEIWKWAYEPLRSTGDLVQVFGGGGEEPTPKPIIAYVRLKDGVVVEKWRG
ncbi:hypothetical protein L6R50_12605 [Myxococcota bacterium]|nr:hypothetical protein [Myxococcota bacterium]